MLNYIEYLEKKMGMPALIVTILVMAFFILQIIGEILEVKGKVVPEFVKIRKYFARKKHEKQIVSDTERTLRDVQSLLADVKQHYSEDNIKLRDGWMHDVDEDRSLVHTLEKLILNMRNDVLKLRIEAMRSEIIAFASKVVDENCLVTREQYRRIFKLYEEYEKILTENGMENGEIDTNYRMINESYEHRVVNHTFLEDIRRYNK